MLLPQHAHFSHVSGAQNIKILQNVKSLRMQFTFTRIFLFSEKMMTFDSVALGKIKVNLFLTEYNPSPLISCTLTLVSFKKKMYIFQRCFDKAV